MLQCNARGCDNYCKGSFCGYHSHTLAIIRRRIKRAQKDKLLHVELDARQAEMKLRGGCDYGHWYRIRFLVAQIESQKSKTQCQVSRT